MKKILLLILVLLLPANAFASALSVAAGKLSAGQWVSFPTSNYNSGDFGRPYNFSTNTQGCYPGSLWQDQDKGAGWYAGDGTLMANGGVHVTGNTLPCNAGTTIRYTESTDSWDRSIAQVCCTVDDSFASQGTTGHVYHDDTVNTTNGDMYHSQYNSNKVMKWTHASNSWSQCSQWGGGSNNNAGRALEYFPDRNTLVIIDGFWGVWELDISSNCTGSWQQLASTYPGTGGPGIPAGLPAIGGYSQQSRYSTLCHCIVMGGGTTTSTAVWRFMSNGTFQSVTTTGMPPSGIIVTGASAGSIMTMDPASGKILVWDATNAGSGVYEYNPSTNVWAFIATKSPLFPTATLQNQDTIAIPISTYGVVMLIHTSDFGQNDIYLYKHGVSAPDTTPPTTPTNLVATAASSSQINLSWTASTDNIVVAGYNVERCTGAACSNFAEVYTPTANSQNDTGLTASTLYRYRVRAHDASGNLSGYSTIAQATTQAGGGGGTADFATRCAAPGVVRCVSFDTDADFYTGSNDVWGAFGHNYGYFPTNSNYTNITRDTTVKTSGASSMRLRTPGTGSSGDVGAWFANFSSDLDQNTFTVQTVNEGGGANSEMWVQFRFRVDSNMLNQTYSGSSGFKIAYFFDGGDTPSCPTSGHSSFECATSCWIGENLFTTDKVYTAPNHLLIAYSNCQANVNSQVALGSPQPHFDRQNKGLNNNANGCWYDFLGGSYKGPNCTYLTANEWWTFKGHVKINTYSSWTNTLEVWVGREGQPLTKLVSCGPTVQCGDLGATGWYIADAKDAGGWNPAIKLGKIWFSSYQTGGSWSGLQDAYIWYDDLIISRLDIADPSSTPPPPDTTIPAVAITNPIPPTASTTTSPIAVSGTATDNVSVTSVTWTCIQCVTKGGTATSSPGTSISWLIPALDLVSGANVVNVVAHDAAGNVSTAASITITYTPSTTYWVRPTGTMSGCTASGTAPTTDAGYKSTITAGVNCMASGGHLIIRAGTYNERLDEEAGGITYPRATSWAGASIIEALAGETVTVLPQTANGNAVIRTTSTGTNYYLWFMGHNRNFVIDGTNVNNGMSNIKIQSPFVRLDSMEVKNGQTQNGGNGVIVVDPATGVEILNSNIHNNGIVGDVNGQSYGIYAQSPNTIITGNDIHDNTGYGIQIYKSGGTPTNNTFANNRVYNNGCTTNIGAVLIQGTSHKVYNNLIYQNCGRPLEAYFSGDETGTVFYGNTLYGNINSDFALFLNNGVTARNNISINNAGTMIAGPTNGGTGSATADHNLCSGICEFGSNNVNDTAANTFVNAGAANFHLGPNAFAKDQGVSTLGAPYNVDFDGLPRTSPWDIGAYEFVSSGTSPVVTIVNPTSNPTLSVTQPLFSLGGTSNLP